MFIAAFVTFLLITRVIGAPPIAVIVNTGLVAVEPALELAVPPIIVRELSMYSIPVANVTSTSAVVFPTGILKLIVSDPAEKSAIFAKCIGESADALTATCPNTVPAERVNNIKTNRLINRIALFLISFMI